MLWFKHMSNARDDGKMTLLRDAFGAEGYGTYWAIVEVIAQATNDKNFTAVSHSVKSWAIFCRISAKKFKKIAEFLKNLKIFEINFESFEKSNEELVTISMPNILDYKDNYTKDKLAKKSKSCKSMATILPIDKNREDKESEKDSEKEKRQEEIEKASYESFSSAELAEASSTGKKTAAKDSSPVSPPFVEKRQAEPANQESSARPLLAPQEPLHTPQEPERTQQELLHTQETKLPKAQAIISLPLNSGQEHSVYQADIDQWQELYPAVDVMQELRNMLGWIIGNPKKRKTKNGILRFITRWLADKQDKGGSYSQPCASPYARYGNANGHPAAPTEYQKRKQEHRIMASWALNPDKANTTQNEEFIDAQFRAEKNNFATFDYGGRDLSHRQFS